MGLLVLAQIPTASTADIVTVLLGLAALTAIIGGGFWAYNQAKHAVAPSKPVRPLSQRLVTKAELESLRVDIKSDFADFKSQIQSDINRMNPAYVTHAEFSIMMTEIKGQMEKNDLYLRTRMHEFSNTVGVLSNRLTAVAVKLGVMTLNSNDPNNTPG